MKFYAARPLREPFMWLAIALAVVARHAVEDWAWSLWAAVSLAAAVVAGARAVWRIK